MPISQTSEKSLANLKPKNKFRNGLNLNQTQSDGAPQGLSNEIVIIPSTSQPNWGSVFIVDIREVAMIHNITLQFNVSAISGTSGTVANMPHFTPAYFWINRIEILQSNGSVIDTLYGVQQHLINNWLENDFDRVYLNNGCGNYASQAQRNTLALSTSNYFVNLKTYFDQTHMSILNQNHNIQLKVYLDTLANNAVSTGQTGTPVATINFCNAIVKLTKLPQTIVNEKLNSIVKSPNHHFFHSLLYGNYTLLIGTSSSQTVLTAITGKIACLWFIIRRSDKTTKDDSYSYVAVKDFAILNSSGTNIVGGAQIPAALATNYLNLYWCNSSYASENSFGLSANNNNANIYMWSFSSDPVDALSSGKLLTSRQFFGNEQLIVNFKDPLADSNHTLEVYAMCESMLEQGINYVKKISL
jgi:hypothetical protein